MSPEPFPADPTGGEFAPVVVYDQPSIAVPDDPSVPPPGVS